MKRLLQLILCCAIFLPAAVFAVPPHPDLLKKWEKEGVLTKKMAAFNYAQAVKGYDRVSRSFPTSGTRNVLVVLVNYSDTSFDSASTTDFYRNLFETGTGLTWKKYYQDMSNGDLTLTFDIYGPYNASNAHNYYGTNDSTGSDSHPAELVTEAVTDLIADKGATVDFSIYDNDGDGNVDSVIVIHQGPGEEVSGSANDIWSHASSITDITSDGVKFNTYAVQPEYLAAAGDSTIGVFCHEFGHVLGLPDTYDTTVISQNPTTYQTAGIGQWSLMAGGTWNGPAGQGGSVPAPLVAWERIDRGWLTPVSAENNGIYTVTDINSSNQAYKVPLKTLPIVAAAGSSPFSGPVLILVLVALAGSAPVFLRFRRKWIIQTAAAVAAIPCIVIFSPGCGSEDKTSNLKNYDQYLLIENIVSTPGSWTEYLPGEGLLITKIDEYFIAGTRPTNMINGAKDESGTYMKVHGVNVMEAGYTASTSMWAASSNQGLATDTYPNGTVTSIGPDTASPFDGPNTNYTNYDSNGDVPSEYNANSGVTISNISAKSASMTFTVTRE